MSRFFETLRRLVFSYPRQAVASLTVLGLALALSANLLGQNWLALFLATLGFAVSAGYIAGCYRHGKGA